MAGTIGYVHGYTTREQVRLLDQASTLSELLLKDTGYPAGATVLEAGCGVGAQTVALARSSPGATITATDISMQSLEVAQRRVEAAGCRNVTFQHSDIFNLEFPEASFDHVFVCFVLEHLMRPREALHCLRSRLKPGGSLTVIEGDHGSAFFHPDSTDARRTIECLIDLQARSGGNALIGRQLYPLVAESGFRNVNVTARQVYVDGSRPEWAEGFIENTFTAMVAGVREQALAARLIDEPTWERGISALRRTAAPDGVFCYTFFKATAIR